jgi:tocopherol O-methyltransferase
MHHGYYPTPNFKDHQAAQRLMIEKSLEFAFTEKSLSLQGKKMVDVGCGVGGSSRYIISKYGGQGEGLSLSPYQIQRAKMFTEKAQLSSKLNYQVADAMNMPFPDKIFDLTWSMESGEHMPDKTKFMNELYRVTAPDGRMIIVTWCHRELQPGETSLQPWETKLLNQISKAYYLPAWVPASQYVNLATSLGLEDVRSADWSEYVLPFWPAVIRSALVPSNFIKMFKSGMVTVKGAIASVSLISTSL